MSRGVQKLTVYRILGNFRYIKIFRMEIFDSARPKISLVSGGFALRKLGRLVENKLFLARIFLLLYARHS